MCENGTLCNILLRGNEKSWIRLSDPQGVEYIRVLLLTPSRSGIRPSRGYALEKKVFHLILDLYSSIELTYRMDLCRGPCATVSFHVGLRGSTLRGCINLLMHPLSVCIFNLVTLLKEVDEDWEVVTIAIDK